MLFEEADITQHKIMNMLLHLYEWQHSECLSVGLFDSLPQNSHALQRMNIHDFGDSLYFSSSDTMRFTFVLKSEMSQQLLVEFL